MKLKSPEFILPAIEKMPCAKVLEDYKSSVEQLKKTRDSIDLFEMINLPAFGELTKLELLYFVLFHTQRHIHQLKKNLENLEKNEDALHSKNV